MRSLKKTKNNKNNIKTVFQMMDLFRFLQGSGPACPAEMPRVVSGNASVILRVGTTALCLCAPALWSLTSPSPFFLPQVFDFPRVCLESSVLWKVGK